MSKASTQRRVAETFEKLLQQPPANEVELKVRLRGVPAAPLRAVAVGHLVCEDLKTWDKPVLLAIFDQVGLKKERRRLRSLLADSSASVLARNICFEALVQAGEDIYQVASTVNPQDLDAMARQPMLDLLHYVELGPEGASAVADALRSIDNTALRQLCVAVLEQDRVEQDISAFEVYREALADPQLAAIRDLMLAPVVAEGAVDAVTHLEALRDRTTDEKARRAFQGALLRIRSARIAGERRHKQLNGYAYVGSCDGQSAYTIFACFLKPIGTMTIVNMVIRASEGIRDGWVSPMATEKDLAETLEIYQQKMNCKPVRIPLLQLAPLIEEGIEAGHRLKRPVPRNAQRSLDLFRPLLEVDYEPAPEPTPVSRLNEKEARALLAQGMCSTSWFFDRGDLEGYDIELPSDRTASSGWIQNTAARLNVPLVRDRVLAMARHMARYHHWLGNEREAAVFAAMRQQLEQDFVKSVLIRVMLERSLTRVGMPGIESLRDLGEPDSDLRSDMRARFFSDITSPRGRDLAQLDMTVEAFQGLDAACSRLRGDRRFPETERYGLAHVVGKHFGSFLCGEKHSGCSPDEVVEAALREAGGFTRKERQNMANELAEHLAYFAIMKCDGCPTGCCVRPNALLHDAFFSPDHPSDAAVD